MIKICHITTVHKYNDIRIFHKMCTSLTKKYDVHLIAPNVDDHVENNVHIHGVSLPHSRIKRYLSLKKVLVKALDVKADLYHLHDPELMKMGVILKKRGKKVIFDSHEDIPLDIAEKRWIPAPLRPIISAYYNYLQNKLLPDYDAVISVTPTIVDKLRKINHNAYQITNYPIYEDFIDNRQWNSQVCFAGVVGPNWMHHKIISSIKNLNVVYNVVGPANEVYLKDLQDIDNSGKINYKGIIKHSEVLKFLQEHMAGMALYDYLPSFGYKKGSLGNNKIFEYMAAGIPVIATDFDLWRDIIEKYECGICVNPHDTDAIKKAITYIKNNPQDAKRMGDNGSRISRELYNWESQKEILYMVYDKVLDL